MNHFKLPHSLVEREKFLLSLCEGKRVLHLGCTDAPFTRESIAADRWLHSKLTAVARECVGVDIDSAAIRLLREEFDINNIVQGNAEELHELNRGWFDVLVAGEIIEHLRNPGRFLESARTVLAPGGRLIITTTNAFCFRRILRIPFGGESVHPDHNFYFSHTTLAHLASSCGYSCIEQHSYRIRNRKPWAPYAVEYLATLLSPNLGEGVVLVCRDEQTNQCHDEKSRLGM